MILARRRYAPRQESRHGALQVKQMLAFYGDEYG